MIRNKTSSLFPVLLLAVLSLTSCSGPFCKTGCTTNGGTGTVSLTLVSDTLPANPSILSFKVSINGIQITPTIGSARTLTPAKPVIDLMRLQSDTDFLGALSNVASGTYTVQVSLSNPTITFFNDTGSNVTAGSTTCANAAVCTATLSATGNPTIASFTLTVTSTGQQGVGLDFNLKNAISLSGGTLSVNFNPTTPVLSAFTLPRSNANLGSNQLELIEDFTGVVTLSGNNITITSPTRGALTTAIVSGTTFFDQSPTPSTLCTNAPSNCAAAGQIASVDAFLNSDGTLSLKEFEPLAATQQDLVEGIVCPIPTCVSSPTQFGIVVTEKTQAATGSLIGGVNTGDLLRVNLATGPTFLVDTKGLPVSSTSLFAGAGDTSVIHPGQTVSVHVKTFTAASGTPPIASVTADTVTLRWSRLIASVFSASPTVVNVDAVPSYFLITSSSLFPTQVFGGNPGGDGVTNLDGIPSGGSAIPSPPPVGLRVLYLDNSSHSAQFPFLAAKIRQH